MADLKNLKARFAAGRKRGKAKATPKPSRRMDFKGERVRINLRVPADLGEALRLQAADSGCSLNEICVDLLSGAVKRKG